MTTSPSRPRDFKGSETAETGRANPWILVRSPRPLPARPRGGIDVRPGAAAAYDGGRVKFALNVTGPDRRVRLPWFDRDAIDETVASMVESGAANFVRFGDRADCRQAIGSANTAIVERGLTRTARAADRPLVTWTTAPSRDFDNEPYDVVVERASVVG